MFGRTITKWSQSGRFLVRFMMSQATAIACLVRSPSLPLPLVDCPNVSYFRCFHWLPSVFFSVHPTTTTTTATTTATATATATAVAISLSSMFICFMPIVAYRGAGVFAPCLLQKKRRPETKGERRASLSRGAARHRGAARVETRYAINKYTTNSVTHRARRCSRCKDVLHGATLCVCDRRA